MNGVADQRLRKQLQRGQGSPFVANPIMPMATEPDQHDPSFIVPTVDIGPYLADSNSSEANEVLDKIRDACVSTGFFQIINHGISPELQKACFDAAAAFFKLPFEEKMKLDEGKTIGHRGYDVLATESFEDGVLPDLKEVKLPVSSI
jgi:hypothetical protein